jgi:hypothetical protein
MTGLRAVAAVLEPFGLEFSISRHFIDHDGTRIVLDSIHNGVLLAIHMLGLAWYRAARLDLGVSQTVRTLLIFGLWVLPLQLSTQLCGLLALAAGWDAVAVGVLHTGGWLATAVVAVTLTERDASARAQPPSDSRDVSSRSQ